MSEQRTHGFTYTCPHCQHSDYVSTTFWLPDKGWQCFACKGRISAADMNRVICGNCFNQTSVKMIDGIPTLVTPHCILQTCSYKELD